MSLCPSAHAVPLPSAPLELPDGSTVTAELALDAKTHERGLMYRTELPDGRGMLFVFPEEQDLTFWMKNTWIDLDMVFIGADRRVVRVFERVPRSYPDTPESGLATASARAEYVLEIPAGYAGKHGIVPGASLRFDVPKVSPGPPTSAKAAAEAAGYLRRLIEMDTRNPPGRELAAARYLAGVLRAAGIPAEVLVSSRGRGNLIARLKGDGSKKPVLLLSHLDTVGFEKERWSTDPVRAELRDGYLYGRGAVDAKGLAAVELTALLDLKRRGRRLKRDVILAAVADEETGGEAGTRWLLEKHPEKLSAEYAVNEGGATLFFENRIQIVGVESAEKLYEDVRMTANGLGGHSSAPAPGGAIPSLSRAVSSLEGFSSPARLNAVTRAFFGGIRGVESARNADAIDALLSGEPGRQARGAEILSESPRYNAMLRDTVAPTMIEGGLQSNVVPSKASAVLNCRLLPDTDPAVFLERLSKAAGNGVELKVISPAGPPPPIMPSDNEMFAAFRSVAQELAPGAVSVPYMSPGSTDSAYLRRAGILTYGFGLPLAAEDYSRIHGDDERVPVGGLGWGAVFLYRLLEVLGG